MGLRDWWRARHFDTDRLPKIDCPSRDDIESRHLEDEFDDAVEAGQVRWDGRHYDLSELKAERLEAARAIGRVLAHVGREIDEEAENAPEQRRLQREIAAELDMEPEL
jgi:hypothetical protein